ncbi:MFS transporter [Neolewinella antarctica]|uniref:UMF1 family MFS transporter n=1 Tax=Neolewinella antarctica TaxID=442734 RepID=A0ABX0X7N6_9BACT|nr:MFS transporter [Neolewinella antarctica]NJC25226.1 UMF1 family MFS transporter [Neolewinella antarctica]
MDVNKTPDATEDGQLNDKRTLNGWALFDWANSAFALVITTAIFPPYWNSVTDETISFFGAEISNSSWFTATITIAYLIIAVLSPILSGIADAGGRRKSFLRSFTIMGGLACLSLFFFEGPDTLWLGTIGFALGLIGFAGGLVFYNSFLPVIATADRFDKLSARGFAMGYIGSVLLLILNLVMVQKPEFVGAGDLTGLPAWLGDPDTFMVRLAFVTVGVWWLIFANISLARLPDDVRVPGAGLADMAGRGWREFTGVWQKIKAAPNTVRFLSAFFSYSAGVQTVIFLASLFASKELGFETSELIVVVLILQVVAIAGAYLAAAISKKYGNKVSIYVQLVIWTGICLAGYFVQDKSTFYLVAASVGLVMGGIQSMSRSTYAKLVPTKKDVTSYFSFFDILEKVAIVMGTAIFAILDQITGSMRLSLLALSFFFALGMILLRKFKIATDAPVIDA